MATHWKNPVRRRMPAITIMPASRKMTLRSIAVERLLLADDAQQDDPVPPSRAAMVLSIRSLAMNA